MKAICNSIGACSHCIDCGAALVHDQTGCEPCPVVETAKCVELEPITDFDNEAYGVTIFSLAKLYHIARAGINQNNKIQRFIAMQNQQLQGFGRIRVGYTTSGPLEVRLYKLTHPTK